LRLFGFMRTLNVMNSQTDIAIRVRNLVKIYNPGSSKQVKALDGLSLEVARGEIFGLLGKNGAGKTTLLRILTTLVQPTEGSAEVNGFDVVKYPYKVRQSICAVLQENAVEVFLTVLDNLSTFARFHSIPREEIRSRADVVISQFGLEDVRHQRVIDLSGGLKRRVQVAKVFMVDKPVVFLDEATTGMDPVNKRATLDAIREQSEQGRTILLTTHMLQEVEELCGRIAIIDRGKCIATGALPMIKSMAAAAYDITVTFERLRPEILDTVKHFPLSRMRTSQTTIEMSINAPAASAFELLEALTRVGPIVHFEVTSASLEDVFLELLGPGGTTSPAGGKS
jgi:ABC-2 type transport system ATP-binding protein